MKRPPGVASFAAECGGGSCMLLQRLLHAVVGVALLRASDADSARMCVSKASTVPFAKRGQPPGPADLNGLCSECVPAALRASCAARAEPPSARRSYRSETCCERAQTDDIRRRLYALTRTSDASDECVSVWLATACSVCAPEAGVAPDGMAPICGSMCDKLHAACEDAYFALDAVRARRFNCSGVWSDARSTACRTRRC